MLLVFIPFVELSSTDAWMESVIKKRQQKKGMPLSSQPVPSNMDRFEELNRYLSRPRLRREECPNPVAYWGVSGFGRIVFDKLMFFISINLRIRFSV